MKRYIKTKGDMIETKKDSPKITIEDKKIILDYGTYQLFISKENIIKESDDLVDMFDAFFYLGEKNKTTKKADLIYKGDDFEKIDKKQDVYGGYYCENYVMKYCKIIYVFRNNKWETLGDGEWFWFPISQKEKEI